MAGEGGGNVAPLAGGGKAKAMVKGGLRGTGDTGREGGVSNERKSGANCRALGRAPTLVMFGSAWSAWGACESNGYVVGRAIIVNGDVMR